MTIIAPTNLPATMPAGASAFYARNISALLLNFVKDGELNLDFDDEITGATVITHDGKVVHEATAKLLGHRACAGAPAASPAPEPRSRAEPAARRRSPSRARRRAIPAETGRQPAGAEPTPAAAAEDAPTAETPETAETIDEPEPPTTEGGAA